MTALAAVRAPGYQPYDDEDGHRYQPDDDKRLERGDDPACGRNGKPYGEDRAEDGPDDPAHIPIMRPAHLAGGCHTGRECRRSLSAGPAAAPGGHFWSGRMFYDRRRPRPRVSRIVALRASEPPFGTPECKGALLATATLS